MYQSLLFFCLSCLFMFWAGIWNGAMDILVHKFDQSIFANLKNVGFWNPETSWRKKWDANLLSRGILKEKFWLSSTYLVWLTDGWHLCKSVFLLWVGLAIICFRLPNWSFLGLHPSVFVNSVICFIFLKAAFGCGKHLAYDEGGFLLKKKSTASA